MPTLKLLAVSLKGGIILAQGGLPTITPSTSGLPSSVSSDATEILSWVLWGAILAVLGAFFYHVAKWAMGDKARNYEWVSGGKSGALRAAAAALLLGIGQAIIYGLFNGAH